MIKWPNNHINDGLAKAAPLRYAASASRLCPALCPMKEMYIFDYDLHDHELDYQPSDTYDFEFWITVNVGDGVAGCLYQVHICTPLSIKQITNKKGCFLIEEWEGLDLLIAKMNQFIEMVLDKNLPDDPFFCTE